jgi:FtsP/CotA-like multicopper oxidase with cupredoxin domain
MKFHSSTLRTLGLSCVVLLGGLGLTAAAAECSDATATGQELQDPPTVVSSEHLLRTPLKATVLEKCINGKLVALMSYKVDTLPDDSRPVGPAFILNKNPADMYPPLIVDFENDLGVCVGEKCDCGGVDVGICTNLHTHGLHVSPTGNSDNVLLSFQPGDTFQFQFNLPVTHAPGTHWIHAHKHGSTALQMEQGMSGALILNGPIDSWMAAQGIETKILILQQLRAKINPDDDETSPLCGDRTTSINGQCLPKISARGGSILRLRLIHAGIYESVYFSFRDDDGHAFTLNEYSRDGINLGRMIAQTTLELQPGYRSDLLFEVPQCPDGQSHCTVHIVDKESLAAVSLHGVDEEKYTIATIEISSSDTAMTLPLADDPHFAKPYREIADSELVQHEVKMYFSSIPAGATGNETGTSTKHTVNGEVFPEGEPISLKLNDAQTWRVWVGDSQSSDPGPSHPFHIHVNPFEVIIRDPLGNIIDRYWKDTYLISSSKNKGEANSVELRTRYEIYTGDYVMHCHNLNHEDAGMMKLVSLSLSAAGTGDH